jgi:hypothetical protein
MGIFVFLIWPPMLVVMYFFSDYLPVDDVRGELIDLLGYLSILPVSCVGAWLGAIIRRHYHKVNSFNSSPT